MSSDDVAIVERLVAYLEGEAQAVELRAGVYLMDGMKSLSDLALARHEIMMKDIDRARSLIERLRGQQTGDSTHGTADETAQPS